jgi:hypothetical protein
MAPKDINDFVYPFWSFPSERHCTFSRTDFYGKRMQEQQEQEREQEREKWAKMGGNKDDYRYFFEEPEGQDDPVRPLRRTSSFDKLNINNDATETEIIKAYRDLCKIHHPDKGGVHEDFIELTNNYEECLIRCRN